MEDLGTECEKLVWDQASLNGVICLPLLLSLYNVEKEVLCSYLGRQSKRASLLEIANASSSMPAKHFSFDFGIANFQPSNFLRLLIWKPSVSIGRHKAVRRLPGPRL